MNNCKHMDKKCEYADRLGMCGNLTATCARSRTMSDDLISRQAAIDEIGNLSDEMYRTVEKGATFPTKAWFDGMAQAEHIVKNLPSAQPKTGKWIIFPPCIEEVCMCTNCKTSFKKAYQHREKCPQCGAKMKGAER